MTKAGEKLIAAAQEARQIAAGEIPAARIWHNGHAYEPVSKIERLTAENERLRAALEKLAVLGEHGMAPSYGKWLSFHDKVAAIANDALRSCQQSGDATSE